MTNGINGLGTYPKAQPEATLAAKCDPGYGCPAHDEPHPCGACAMDASRHDLRPYAQRARLTPHGSQPWDFAANDF